MTTTELAALEALIERVIARQVGDRLTDIEGRLVGLTDAVVSLGGKVTSLEIETRDMASRLGRLRTDIMSGRTADTQRLGVLDAEFSERIEQLETRLTALERKGPP